MNEAKLIEKLKLIEALFAGATTPGERVAADAARLRILERLNTFEVADPPVEYKFTLGDLWARRVFVALLRRYDLKPYRYRGQRYTTVMVKVSKRFAVAAVPAAERDAADLPVRGDRPGGLAGAERRPVRGGRSVGAAGAAAQYGAGTRRRDPPLAATGCSGTGNGASAANGSHKNRGKRRRRKKRRR